MSETPEPTTSASLEGAYLKQEVFLVPAHPFPGSALEADTHAEIQTILNLLYAMLACGMDSYTIKARIMANE